MPEHRGKVVGKVLWVEDIFPWCRLCGFTPLGVCVMAHSTGAIAFYENQGFTVIGYTENGRLGRREIGCC